MSTPTTTHTSKFVDPFPYLALLFAAITLVAMGVAPFIARTVAFQTLTVEPGSSGQLPPIQIAQQRIGAVRIDANASLANNRWVSYEIQLKDQQGKVIASALKEAWNESGTWAEEGESGAWAESDADATIDLRALQSEPVTISVAVLNHSNNLGQEVEEPVPIQVRVQTGVVDDRYLWAGLIGSVITAVLSFFSVPTSGRKVLSERNKDSELTARGTLGGPNKLLRLKVKIKADETAPAGVYLRLAINDENGERLYYQSHSVTLNRAKNDKGRFTSGSGSKTLFFVLSPEGSYGIHVEISPDRSIDRTELEIRQGARTIVPVAVTTLPEN
jgi:hypothetical protein